MRARYAIGVTPRRTRLGISAADPMHANHIPQPLKVNGRSGIRAMGSTAGGGARSYGYLQLAGRSSGGTFFRTHVSGAGKGKSSRCSASMIRTVPDLLRITID